MSSATLDFVYILTSVSANLSFEIGIAGKLDLLIWHSIAICWLSMCWFHSWNQNGWLKSDLKESDLKAAQRCNDIFTAKKLNIYKSSTFNNCHSYNSFWSVTVQIVKRKNKCINIVIWNAHLNRDCCIFDPSFWRSPAQKNDAKYLQMSSFTVCMILSEQKKAEFFVDKIITNCF